jgi:hypothetical protein
LELLEQLERLERFFETTGTFGTVSQNALTLNVEPGSTGTVGTVSLVLDLGAGDIPMPLQTRLTAWPIAIAARWFASPKNPARLFL